VDHRCEAMVDLVSPPPARVTARAPRATARAAALEVFPAPGPFPSLARALTRARAARERLDADVDIVRSRRDDRATVGVERARVCGDTRASPFDCGRRCTFRGETESNVTRALLTRSTPRSRWRRRVRAYREVFSRARDRARRVEAVERPVRTFSHPPRTSSDECRRARGRRR